MRFAFSNSAFFLVGSMYHSWDPQTIFFKKTILKLDPTPLFTYLKINYFATVFLISSNK